MQKYSTMNIDDNIPPNLNKIWSDTFSQVGIYVILLSFWIQVLNGKELKNILGLVYLAGGS